MNQKRQRTDNPESRLDRVSRDLNRSFLHGTRVETTAGTTRPASVVTGQQIPVDLPDEGGLAFAFTRRGTAAVVDVTREAAETTVELMKAVLDNPDKYLRLTVDENIPTWVFHQREFTLPQTPVPEELAAIPNPARTVQRLAATVLQEIQALGAPGDVTLLEMDADTQTETPLPRTWQPAILLRFPLEPAVAERVRGAAGDERIFEVRGTPQGDRFYLDQLRLLSGATADSPGIDAVFLLLQHKGGPLAHAERWTLARTNLTEEARPTLMRSSAAPAPFPFIATQDQPEDGLRLLQMASITNSGGYFLRAAGGDADTLVVCVILKAESGTKPSSVLLPLAANAISHPFASPPDVARLEGNRSVHVVPFAPAGHLSFGWTRTEPVEKQNDEERFGFGTISLVDFQAADAAGHEIHDDVSDTAISPLRSLPGEHVPRRMLASVDGRFSQDRRQSAAMRVVTAGEWRARLQASGEDGARYYRATLRCHGGGESRFAALRDPATSTITVTPGFRDVFGNRFMASPGATLTRRLFYTDALIAPSEWPGFQFTLYPGTDAGRPILTLQAVYTPAAAAGDDKVSRYLRLVEIRDQLEGARNDVRLTLAAPPLLGAARDLLRPMLEWLEQVVIPLETPGTLAVSARRAAVPVTRSFPFPCDVRPLTVPERVLPTLTVTRTDAGLLPGQHDLPDDETLAATIAGQIATAESSVMLAARANGRLFLAGTPDRPDEFRCVAEAFQAVFAAGYRAQAAFGRNQLNQHELWFLPDALLPKADRAASPQFATARPLSNKLGTNEFLVPDFETPSSAVPNWHGFALREEHFIEQDFDELGRTVTAFLDQRALDPEAVTDAAQLDAARTALQQKDRIARRLAHAGAGDGAEYLIPLFEGSGASLDRAALERLGADAFLKKLSSFYTVDTFVQLPLAAPLDAAHFAALEGKFRNPFVATPGAAADDPANRLPAFSDVLLQAAERNVTVLYDVPPGVRDPNGPDVPPVPGKPDAFAVTVTHVQRNPDPLEAKAAAVNPFNRGVWLELAQPVQLAWPGTNEAIPVAVRRFPAKPILEVGTISAAPLQSPLPEARVPLLGRWGWQFAFSVEGLESDVVHAIVRYNERPESFARTAIASTEDWRPTDLLHCLVVLRQLADRWPLIPAKERMPMIAELLTSLERFLGEEDPIAVRRLEPPRDVFDVAFEDHDVKVTVLAAAAMSHIAAEASDTGSGAALMKRVSLTADAEPNAASVLVPGHGGSEPVYNFRPSLKLVRNERIGGRAVERRLVYECAAVEAPRERWALNVWPAPLAFQHTAGQSLQKHLQRFFQALLGGADIERLGIEVSVSLDCRRGSLAVSTPFCVVPIDVRFPTPGALADTIFSRTRDLLGAAGPGDVQPPPEVDASALALHVKVSLVGGEPQPRTLLDAAAITFAL